MKRKIQDVIFRLDPTFYEMIKKVSKEAGNRTLAKTEREILELGFFEFCKKHNLMFPTVKVDKEIPIDFQIVSSDKYYSIFSDIKEIQQKGDN